MRETYHEKNADISVLIYLKEFHDIRQLISSIETSEREQQRSRYISCPSVFIHSLVASPSDLRLIRNVIAEPRSKSVLTVNSFLQIMEKTN